MSKGKTDKASVRKRGILEMVGGLALAGIGALVSFASYNAARAGESYTVYTGVIALGVVYAALGAWHVAFPNAGKKNKTEESAKDTETTEVEIVDEE